MCPPANEPEYGHDDMNYQEVYQPVENNDEAAYKQNVNYGI